MLIYEPKYTKFILNSKEIFYRPWNTLDEKNYLLLNEDKDNITEEDLYEILIKPCIKNPEKLKLTLNERKILMIEIRKKSLGSTFNMKYNCGKCKKVNEITCSLDSVIKYKKLESKEILVTDEDTGTEYIFKINEPVSSNLLKRLNSNTSSSIDYLFTELLVHIEYIVINSIKNDTFTYDELKDFMDSLPSNMFDKIFSEFQKCKETLRFEVEHYCLMCNNKNTVDLEGIPGFLWG
jgi:hypothetical protein